MTIKQLKEKLKNKDKNFEIEIKTPLLIIYYRKQYTNEKVELMRAKYDESVLDWLVWMNNITVTQGQTYLLTYPLNLIHNLNDPIMVEQSKLKAAEQKKRKLYESDYINAIYGNNEVLHESD